MVGGWRCVGGVKVCRVGGEGGCGWWEGEVWVGP